MKQKERLNKIREYLIQQKKATWTDISNATKIQPKELSGDLKHLLGRNEVICEQGTKDRRITWYMLTYKKRTDAEIKLYETTEFILSMKNTDGFEKFIKEFDFNIEMMAIDSVGEAMFRKEAQKEDMSVEEFLEIINKPRYSSIEEMFKKADRIEIMVSFRRKKKT